MPSGSDRLEPSWAIREKAGSGSPVFRVVAIPMRTPQWIKCFPRCIATDQRRCGADWQPLGQRTAGLTERVDHD